MLKKPFPQQDQFETITLDELVPEDHLVCKIDAAIDFEFIRDASLTYTALITADPPSTTLV